jgi:hypothetical protein
MGGATDFIRKEKPTATDDDHQSARLFVVGSGENKTSSLPKGPEVSLNLNEDLNAANNLWVSSTTAKNVRKQKPTGITAASHSPSSLQQNLAKGL